MEEKNWKKFEKEIANNLSLFVQLPKFEDNKKDFLTKLPEIQKRIANLRVLNSVIGMASKHKEFKKEHLRITQLASYLWLFEGFYVGFIDLFCFLLILSGHDLLDFIRRKYVHSFQDISNVDLSTKFMFLKEHHIGILVREKDKKMRNRIAHHDFTVNKDGEIIWW